jgi:hypothetical protein
MSGAPDPLYVLARRVLLDALDALGQHVESCILVGAQAVYVHTGSARIAVPEYTTDADLALDPRSLKPSPLLAEALQAGQFRRKVSNPGTWLGEAEVEVDLLVPETLGGPGRRGARLPPHGNQVARKAKGLEAALVDHCRNPISSLEPEIDGRAHVVSVAGPTALLVAKLHKIADRTGSPGRSQDKDALDVLRLLQAVPTQDLVAKFTSLASDPISAIVTEQAIAHLGQFFADPAGAGVEMAVRAVGVLDDAETIRQSCIVLARELLACLPSP